MNINYSQSKNWFAAPVHLTLIFFIICYFFITPFCANARYFANISPTAVIKGDTIVLLPKTTLLLNAGSSYDTDGKVVTCKWTQISGPTGYTITYTNVMYITLNNLVLGKYSFKLTVTDNLGATGSAIINFEVKEIRLAAIVTAATAITLPADSIVLDGTKSTGLIKSYAWSQVSGPAGAKFSSTTASKITVKSLTAGHYAFQLVITSTSGTTSSSTVGLDVGNSLAASNSCGCTAIIIPNSDGSINIDGNAMGAKPGNVYCIKSGTYKKIKIINFNGTVSNPIIFKNCGGQVVINGMSQANISITYSSFFRFTGTGSADKYGFKILSPTPGIYSGIGFSAAYNVSDFEADHIELYRVSLGFMVKTDPDCNPLTWQTAFTMQNIKLHDNYVHQTTNEGFYCGYTHATNTVTCNGVSTVVYPQLIKGIRVYNNVIDSTGWDGMQVGNSPQGVLIYNNRVTNYGRRMSSGQQSGITLGINSNGSVFGNTIMNGPGGGLMIFGLGKVYIYNNVFANVGYDTSATSYGQSAIFVDTRPPTPVTKLNVFVANNTIVNPKRFGVYLLNSYGGTGTDNLIVNNFFIMSGKHSAFQGKPVGISGAVPYVGSNNVEVDTLANAKFVDPSHYNFQLTASSPAIGKGKDLSSYKITGLLSDINGFIRPQYGRYDIGAYNYQGTVALVAAKYAAQIAAPPVAVVDHTAEIDLSFRNQLILDGSKSKADANSKIEQYEWRLVDGPLNYSFRGYNGQTLIANLSAEGNYVFELVVTDNNQLRDSAKIFVTAEKSIKNELSLYPLPAKDFVNISLNHPATGKLALRVVDLNGRIIWTGNNFLKDSKNWQGKINVSGFSTGVYFLDIIIGNNEYMGKSKFLKIN